MTSAFLSYARGDDEPFAKRLCEDLTARGFDVWWDRESMSSRGATFLQEIRNAITARDRFVLVVGPGALSSEYVGEEWRYAVKIGKPVNTVLRLVTYDLLPAELQFFDTPDFRDDADYAARLETLARQVAEPVAPMGKLIAVPSLPPHFLKAADRLQRLKEAVLADLHRPVGVIGTARAGIQGMGGIGKSVLAAALARDPGVRRAFPDGLVWVPVGQEAALRALQRDVANAFGDPGLFDNVLQGKQRLHELLEPRAVLLVLDDVWEAGQAEAFDVLGPQSRMLMTTRDAGLITALGGTQHQVHLLTDAEAQVLLAQWAECAVDALPPEARDVIREYGRLPLALAICGAMVRDAIASNAPAARAWSDVLDALREADLEFVSHPLADYPHRDVFKAIKVSIDALHPDEARRFAELAVFPPDESVAEAAVTTLWTHTGGMRMIQSPLLDRLEQGAEAAVAGRQSHPRLFLVGPARKNLVDQQGSRHVRLRIIKRMER